MSEIDDMLRAANAAPRRDRTTERVDRDPDGIPDAETQKGSSAKTQRAAKPEEKPKVDRYILAMYIALCVISIVELYSASSREVASGNIIGPLGRHCMMLLGGIVLCTWLSRVKVRYFFPFAPAFSILSVVLMVYVLINGNIINGARRCFTVMGVQIQPAEFLKISAVLIIAYIMSRNQEKGGVKTKGVVYCALTVLAFGGLLFTQGLTNTILLMAISVSMMLVGGVQWKKFGILMVVYGIIAGGALMYKMKSESESAQETTTIVQTGKDKNGKAATINRSSTWQKRIERYKADSIPKYEQPITAENRQEMYSYMAQANGGIFGVFPGNSRETARLPLAFSDYIYSIVVEDLGFVGGMFLLLIYLSLLARAGTIATRCDRAFPALLVMGMAVMIAFQALFHMAIVTGVFPVSGQPLPMISKGGTSILITSMAFGIMLSVSRYASTAARSQSNKQKPELPSEMGAVNPMQLKS